MIDDVFAGIIRSNKGCAVVLAGSSSDGPHIEKIVASLKEYGIPLRVRICSAHKQPDALMEIIREYDSVGGSVCYVAVAGGTDALSGTLSYHAKGPVISCPPFSPNYTCLSNPPGSPNAYIANPKNIGKFVAQMYAGVNPELSWLRSVNNASKIAGLKEADAAMQERYRGDVDGRRA